MWVGRTAVERDVTQRQLNATKHYNAKKGVKSVDLREDDWVVIKRGGIVLKGDSTFSQPIQVKSRKRDVVILSDGSAWSSGNICKCRPPVLTTGD